MSATPRTLRWPFREHDAFAPLLEEHRLPVIHTLPGVIVWPILLFILAFCFQFVAVAIWSVLTGAQDMSHFMTVVFGASAAAYLMLGVLMWVRFSRYGAHRAAFSILPVRASEFLAAFMALAFVITIGGRLSVQFHDFAMLDPTLTIGGGADPDTVSNIDEFVSQGAAMWSLILLTIIIAPIVEEVLFRGWMLPMMMARGVPIIFAILISSLAFGLIHIGQGLLVMTTTFFLGVALGTARVVTGRVAAPMLGHMANNAWAVFMVPYLINLNAG